MRAAEDHGVDLRPLQRLAVGAHHLHHALLEREAALDHGGQVGGLHLRHRQGPVLMRERAEVGAAPHRGGRREHADLAGLGERRRRSPPRGRSPPRPRSPPRRRSPWRPPGPADAAELQAITSSFAPRSSRKRRHLLDVIPKLLRAPRPVREAGVVAEVDVVLLGQRDEALVEHGEPADARVEHRDRQLGARLGRHQEPGAAAQQQRRPSRPRYGARPPPARRRRRPRRPRRPRSPASRSRRASRAPRRRRSDGARSP